MKTLLEANLLVESNVGTDEEVDNLLNQILKERVNVSTEFTNDNCWRSTTRYNNIDWLLKNITSQVKNLVEYYKNVDEVFSNTIDMKKCQISYWTNINSASSRNVMHSHKSSILSGVYYIQAADTGSLRFINPANMLGECNPRSPFTRDFYFTPSDRDLILWPSWMPHEVEPNYSNKNRINLAFDIVMI